MVDIPASYVGLPKISTPEIWRFSNPKNEGLVQMIFLFKQVSHEINPGWLLYIEDYIITTQLYGDSNIANIRNPYKPINMMECHKGFDRSSGDFQVPINSFSSWGLESMPYPW